MATKLKLDARARGRKAAYSNLNKGNSIGCGVVQHSDDNATKNAVIEFFAIQIIHCLLHFDWCAVFRCGLNACCSINAIVLVAR